MIVHSFISNKMFDHKVKDVITVSVTIIWVLTMDLVYGWFIRWLEPLHHMS